MNKLDNTIIKTNIEEVEEKLNFFLKYPDNIIIINNILKIKIKEKYFLLDYDKEVFYLMSNNFFIKLLSIKSIKLIEKIMELKNIKHKSKFAFKLKDNIKKEFNKWLKNLKLKRYTDGIDYYELEDHRLIEKDKIYDYWLKNKKGEI